MSTGLGVSEPEGEIVGHSFYDIRASIGHEHRIVV